MSKLLQLPNPGNGGRLGNHLFNVAACIGLALEHNYTPRLPGGWKYRAVFPNIPKEWYGPTARAAILLEARYEYDMGLVNYIIRGNSFYSNFDLCGYFQSPEYWQGYEDKIRHYLTPTGCKIGTVDAVGIHYRRGDYIGNPNYVELTYDNYYRNAFGYIDYIEYIARSDDWEFINDYYGQNCGTEIEDFIALAECKQHVISNSSYSWWAAYLSGGDVVAPKQWFAGELAKRCSTVDLIPLNWITI